MKTNCVKNAPKTDKMYHDCQCGKFAFVGNVCLCVQNQNDEICDVPVIFMRKASDKPMINNSEPMRGVA